MTKYRQPDFEEKASAGKAEEAVTIYVLSDDERTEALENELKFQLARVNSASGKMDTLEVGDDLLPEKELVSEEEKDSLGKVVKKAEYAEYRVTSLKLDSMGRRIVMNESALHEFEIKVTQFQIRGVKLDEVSQNQLDVVKKRETQRVANITEAETAKQLAITNEATGKANAAKAKWDAEAEKARVIVKMEQSKDSAIILAERESEVAKRNALKAKYQADSTREAGRAEAEANRLKVQAGLTPQERLAAEVQMNKDKWDAISRIQVPIVPEYNIEGSGKGASGIDALASAKAFEVINGMKTK